MESVLFFLCVYREHNSVFIDLIKNSEPYSLKDLAVNGSDLKKLGFKGKQIGNILDELLEDVINTPEANTKEQLFNKINSNN